MNMATASGRNLFPDNFAREDFPVSTYPLSIDGEVPSRNGFGRKWKRRIKNILVEARAYFSKQ